MATKKKAATKPGRTPDVSEPGVTAPGVKKAATRPKPTAGAGAGSTGAATSGSKKAPTRKTATGSAKSAPAGPQGSAAGGKAAPARASGDTGTTAGGGAARTAASRTRSKTTGTRGKAATPATAGSGTATSPRAGATPRRKTSVKVPVESTAEAGTTGAGARLSPTGQTEVDFVPYEAAPGEEYMNAEQTQHFRNILQSWRRQLMEEVERTVHHMQDDASNFPDPNDRATQEEEFALELRTRDRERKLIKKINDALSALEAGDYGYCDTCGVEIGIRRLEARPTATLCIDCKTLDEIRERQRA